MKYTITDSEFTCLRQGLVIRGVQYKPIGRRRFPIIIVSHGFMDSQKSTRPYAKELAGMGYVTLAFDFCGGGVQGVSDGRTTDMSVLTEIEDLVQVIAYAKTIPEADPDHITLMGFSQGGFVSMLTAAKLGAEEIEQIIPVYPALCIPDDARKGHMMFAKFDPLDIPEVIPCGPMKLGRCYPQAVIDMDPMHEIANYRGKVLLIHGTDDRVVNIRYAKEAYGAYMRERIAAGQTAADAEVSVHIIEGAGHGFTPEYKNYAMQVIALWLQGKREYLTIDVHTVMPDFKPQNVHETDLAFPFGGRADSKYFSGMIQAGACDRQHLVNGKAVTCCADYEIVGKDYTGAACSVHVINRRMQDGPWQPEVKVSGGALAFLANADLTCVFEERKQGPKINIFA